MKNINDRSFIILFLFSICLVPGYAQNGSNLLGKWLAFSSDYNYAGIYEFTDTEFIYHDIDSDEKEYSLVV